MNQEQLAAAVAEAVARSLRQQSPVTYVLEPPIPVGVSARHCHLSPEHVEALFGKGYRLLPEVDLSQPGQYAARERVVAVGPRGALTGLRVLGPPRGRTQVEVAHTDAMQLGISPPVRDSGAHDGSPGLTLVGPKGTVVIESGAIRALRHIHMHPHDAAHYGVRDKQRVWVACLQGDRHTIYGDVLIRVSDRFKLEFHVDTDEANAAELRSGDQVHLVRP